MIRLLIVTLIATSAVLIVLAWFNSSDRVYDNVLFVEPGRLSRYEETYTDYQQVNVRRLDGSLATRPDDLRLLMTELIDFEAGFSSTYPLGVLTPEIKAYHEQDRQVMRRIINKAAH